ncbi:MAG: DNA repair protein RadA, partial [Simkaniaceae bacterium]|nr:DNA repair protein RadA [Simkaniaceae bacterium]
MAKVVQAWSCVECGTGHPKWTGTCSGCGKWNSLIEDVQIPFAEVSQVKPVQLGKIECENFARQETALPEFDRLLGGGVVRGSLTLVGGAPGIGKSTLMLHLAHAFAQKGLIVLYVCGEESAHQTGMRAERLGIKGDNIFLLAETSLAHVRAQVEAIKPQVLIVDSVQIVHKKELSSMPGSVTQVREVAMECMRISKGLNITTFLIGHVTKSGELAGPRVLEHLVDTVLEFEGDKQHGYRILRSIKNRFGSTDDLVIFEMGGEGLKEVSNPSKLFLEERQKEVPGSAIAGTVEGSRAYLVEIQALIAQTSYPNPTRKSTGLDQNRLALLLAVIEKRLRYQLYTLDVFVSVVGGLKINEPAVDLAILTAIASS